MIYLFRAIIPTVQRLIILGGIVLFSSTTWADEKTLVIHAVDYPPYEIENPREDGLLGFDVEVVVEAFGRVGIKARVDFLPWNRILSMAERGGTTAALSCAKSQSRNSYINYSDPISSSTNVYVALTDYSGKIPKTLPDGKDSKIVVVRGYNNELDLKEIGIPYHPAINDRAALNILLKRDFDFFYSTREFVKYIAVELKISDQLQYFDVQQRLMYHLCFSRKWPNSEILLEEFNKGLAEIRADGTFDNIHAKYQ